MAQLENINAPLAFDRTIPFVNAVFRLIAGEYALEDALAILEADEEKYGVRIFYSPDNCLGGGSYLPRTSKIMPLSVLYPLLEDYEAFQSAYYLVEDDKVMEEAINTQLLPFLTATHFVLQSLDFANEHFILFSTGLLVPLGWEMWSFILEKWANTIHWLAPASKHIQWTHMDFFANLGPLLHLESYPVVDSFGRWIPGPHNSTNENSPELIENYLAWASVVLKLVEEKTKRQLAQASRTACD